MSEDIRWQRRFQNYQLALQQLTDAVTLGTTRPLSDLEKLGLIQAFEYTHELAWNCLKDFCVTRAPRTSSAPAMRPAKPLKWA